MEDDLDGQMDAYGSLGSMRSGGSEYATESNIKRSQEELHQVILKIRKLISEGGHQAHSYHLTHHTKKFNALTQKFLQLRTSLREKQQHVYGAEFDIENQFGSADQALLGESTGQKDKVIWSTFDGITTKISNVSNRLPTINHVLSSIRRKKSMYTIILSLVASICAFLILVYWLSK